MKRRWAVMATMLLAAVGTASAVESWIENGFEYPSGTNGYVGSDATTEGRWGNLQATDVYQYSISDNYAHSGIQPSGSIARSSTPLRPWWPAERHDSPMRVHPPVTSGNSRWVSGFTALPLPTPASL
jgi:hypothetical protein